RELGVCLLHGVPLEKIYLYWMGNEWGSHVDANVAPVSIPVGSHPAHAVGYAWGLRMQKKPGITVSYFGDGATSTGDFYEAMNFAGVFKIPTIFFCQNNQWAISIPRSRQTAAKTLAQKADSAGIPGVQVDGNDIFACFSAMSEAVARARNGEGATLIEAVTYRAGNHTTSDDESRYRPREEVEYWKARDPILRYKLFLQKKGLWKDDFEKVVIKEADEKIQKAVEIASKTPPPKPEEMFDYLFAEPTQTLKDQKEFLLNSLKPNS
ncbi:MAG: thiamine pyrophosphate-dependent enzyme, partial [Patescibacteria group bacterium]